MKETIHTEPLQLTATTDKPYKEAKRQLLDAFEIHYFRELMERHRGNLSAASREAEMSRRHLRHLLRRYDLYQPPRSATPWTQERAQDIDASLSSTDLHSADLSS
jgi:DNA-binding NtrC family response regulator